MREGGFMTKLFKILFYLHLLLFTILAIFLTVRGILSATGHDHPFNARNWYLPVFVSTGFAGIIGFAWQALTVSNPLRTLKVAFWLSPLLTCAVGVLLVSIGTAGSLGAAAVALVSAVIQSLYSCWASPRFEYAGQILSISTALPLPKASAVAILSIIPCTFYSCILLSGIGGATAKKTRLDSIFIFLILLSLAWTSHIIKNTVHTAVSHIKYMQFAFGIETDNSTAFKKTIKQSMGSISIGSILVPVLCIFRGSARAITMASEDVNEFMFSWGMFRRLGMEQLINSDLTSSFCFLCGMAGGSEFCNLLLAESGGNGMATS